MPNKSYQNKKKFKDNIVTFLPIINMENEHKIQ